MKEIADILKIRETTIQTQLMRARQKLKEQLQEEWKNAGETKKKFRKRNVVAACLAAVFILGAGGATVLGNMEINIDSDDYCMRPYLESNSWSVWEYVDTGTDSELVGQEVVKEIIDLNK